MDSLGSRIKKLRLSKHLKQEHLAELVGINRVAITYYENNTRQPTYETLIRLAAIFDVSTDYLLGYPSDCQLNISELTIQEREIVRSLVESMTSKNRKLKIAEAEDDEQE